MHVTVCLAGQKVDVEVGEDCRSLQALREAIVEALPQLCVEGFDVSVGGRALDDDEGVVSLEESTYLDVVPNSRGLSVLALREAGREVSADGLFVAARGDEVTLCTSYLDAGVPIDCRDTEGRTPLHHACRSGHLEIAALFLDRGSTAIDEKAAHGCTPLHYACSFGDFEIATLLLDRGSTAIDQKTVEGWSPLHSACHKGHLSIATLLLDRGSTAIDEKDAEGWTPFHEACGGGHLEIATLLLDRGSTAINEKDDNGWTPLRHACRCVNLALMTLLLDRGCSVDVQEYRTSGHYAQAVLELLSERGHPVLHDASVESAKRRRIGE